MIKIGQNQNFRLLINRYIVHKNICINIWSHFIINIWSYIDMHVCLIKAKIQCGCDVSQRRLITVWCYFCSDVCIFFNCVIWGLNFTIFNFMIELRAESAHYTCWTHKIS
jgi:hypothetical protein